jgi:hypothetical protein
VQLRHATIVSRPADVTRRRPRHGANNAPQ